MWSVRKGLLFIAGVVTAQLLLGAEGAGCPSPQRSSRVKHQRVDLRHIEGGGIGYSQGYTTLGLFLAKDPTNWTSFLDARGHVFNNGKGAFNAGLGGRWLWRSRIYGMNAYYDFRSTHKASYRQVGVGLETLGSLWDLRINGYLPFGDKVHGYAPEFGGFSGHSVLVNKQFELAMWGVDAEAGFHGGPWEHWDLYAAIGPYYFHGEKGHAAIGGKGRLGTSYKRIFSMEVSDSWDGVFHNRLQGQVAFNIPFGPKSKEVRAPRNCPNAPVLTAQMVQPVARQEIVVTRHHTDTDPASNFFVFVDNQSHSQGTFESPYASLADAQNNSHPGDIIYVFPGDGTTTQMSSGITLQQNQKFWGSGVSHPLSTNLGNIVIPALTGINPKITNTGGVGITLADGVEVSGFTVYAANTDGIAGTVQSAAFSDLFVFASMQNGINITESSTGPAALTFDRVEVEDSQGGEDGIAITVAQSTDLTIALSDCTVTTNSPGGGGSPPGNGLVIDTASYPANIFITGGTFSNNGAYGIEILSSPTSAHQGQVSVQIRGSVMSCNGIDGVFVTQSGMATWNSPLPSSFEISQCIAQNNTQHGIHIDLAIAASSGSTSFTVNNNEASYNFAGGIIVAHGSSSAYDVSAVMSNNTVRGNITGPFAFSSIDHTVATLQAENNLLLNTMPGQLFHVSVSANASLCLDLNHNNSDLGYLLDNTAGGVFQLAPGGISGAQAVNQGTITTSGAITSVDTCN